MDQQQDRGRPDLSDPRMDTSTPVTYARGVWAGEALQNDFRGEVAGLLGRHNRSFPGAQPVSFSAQHFRDLKETDYYVCEKTDGIRYLMWSTQDRGRNIVYLIDRKNDYYFVDNLYFPHHDSDWKNDKFDRFHDATILDGELVEDRIPGEKSIMKFLVFDCLVLDGNVLMHRPLDKRLAYFKSFVLEPWRKWYKYVWKNQPDFAQKLLFEIEDKSTEFSYGLEKMFKEIIPRVKKLHGNDGLIFTCKDTPYHPGTDPHILKWKPPEENTVDFLLHIIWPAYRADPDDPDQSTQEDFLSFPEEFSLYIFNGDRHGEAQYDRVASLHVTHEEWEHMKSLNRPLQDSIVECYQEEVVEATMKFGRNGSQDHVNGNPKKRWRFHRFRDDKTEANHVTTFNSVIESIEDHVTEDDLLRQAEEIRSCWKQRDAARKMGAAQQAPRGSVAVPRG